MAAIKRLFGNFRSSRAKKSDSESHSSIQWVVAGLGNPGEEYSRSRHNSGFMTIDRIAKTKGVELNRRRFKGVTAETTLAEKPALLVKPQTFYNLTGECISDLLGYFKIAPRHFRQLLRLQRAPPEIPESSARSRAHASQHRA